MNMSTTNSKTNTNTDTKRLCTITNSNGLYEVHLQEEYLEHVECSVGRSSPRSHTRPAGVQLEVSENQGALIVCTYIGVYIYIYGV